MIEEFALLRLSLLLILMGGLLLAAAFLVPRPKPENQILYVDDVIDPKSSSR